MFSHDALKELVAPALASPHAKRASFACQWAAFIGDESLLAPCYAAMRRFTTMGFRDHQLVSTVIRNSGIACAIAMYNQHTDRHIRLDIVHCLHEAPGPEAVAFLRDRLKEKNHQFSAIQSLGFIGAISAAPEIQELLKTGDGDVRFMAANVLGKLRYVQAADDLIHAMREGDLYETSESLGRIGTPAAYKALEECFGMAKDELHQRQMLIALVRRRDPEGIEAAKRVLVWSSDARAIIASAIGYPDIDERPNEWDDLGPLLSDRVLLREVLDSARKAILSGSKTLDFSLRGVASFDDAAAVAFLEDVAEGRLATQESNTGTKRDHTLEARQLLALRGHAHYEREAVDDALNGVKDDAPSWTLRALSRWSRAVVRDALLARISRGDRLAAWFELLQWFADASDLDLFRQQEQHSDDEVADICHQYLQNNEEGRRPSLGSVLS
jgi:hypothetical protein